MSNNGKILAFPDMAALDGEAAAWVARFDAGDISARDQAAFQAWLNSSALHREYDRRAEASCFLEAADFCRGVLFQEFLEFRCRGSAQHHIVSVFDEANGKSLGDDARSEYSYFHKLKFSFDDGSVSFFIY